MGWADTLALEPAVTAGRDGRLALIGAYEHVDHAMWASVHVILEN